LDFLKIKNTIQQILVLQKQVNTKVGTNLFDNYKYREWLLVHHFNNKLKSNIILQTQRFGPDALNDGKTVEIKTCSLKPRIFLHALSESDFKRGFEWDKQNDPKRRQETLTDQEYIFGMFAEHKCAFAIYINNPNEVKKVHKLLRSKQSAFLKMMTECHFQNKRVSRDSIRLTLDELANYQIQGYQYMTGLKLNQEWFSYGPLNIKNLVDKKFCIFEHNKLSKLKVSKLKVSKLEVSKLKVSKLKVSKLKVSKLEVSKLKVSKLKVSNEKNSGGLHRYNLRSNSAPGFSLHKIKSGRVSKK
jgi:hypothetical protein